MSIILYEVIISNNKALFSIAGGNHRSRRQVSNGVVETQHLSAPRLVEMEVAGTFDHVEETPSY